MANSVILSVTTSAVVNSFAGARKASRENPLTEGLQVLISGFDTSIICDNDADVAAVNACATAEQLNALIESRRDSEHSIGLALGFTLTANGTPLADCHIFGSQLRRVYRLKQGGTTQARGPLADAWHEVAKTATNLTQAQQFQQVLTKVSGKTLFVHLQYITDLSGRDRTVVHLLDHVWTKESDPELA